MVEMQMHSPSTFYCLYIAVYYVCIEFGRLVYNNCALSLSYGSICNTGCIVSNGNSRLF